MEAMMEGQSCCYMVKLSFKNHGTSESCLIEVNEIEI